MHTLVMTLAGLAALAAFVLGAGAISRGRPGSPVDGARAFLWVWAVVSLINFGIGVFVAGYPVPTEIGVHLVIFGVPAAAAWFASGRIARARTPGVWGPRSGNGRLENRERHPCALSSASPGATSTRWN